MVFPWRSYWRFLLLQSGAISLLLVIWTGLILWAIDLNSDDIARLLGLLVLALVVFSGFIAAFGRWHFLPLGRLLERAQSLRQKKALSISAAERENEWDIIEGAMDQVQLDLRQTFARLHEGQTEIQALMSAINDAIVAFDNQGRALFYNERFAHVFLPLKDQGFEVFWVNVFRDSEVRDAFASTVESGQPARLVCSLTPVGSTEPRDYQLAVAPLRRYGPGSEIYGVMAILHDVSDLKQAERIRIEFVGNASHELRTPLTSIKGYVSTLQGDLTQGRMDDADKFLRIIARNVDRLIDLVNDLLDLSSLESHSQTLSFAQQTTAEITENVMKSLEGEAKEKGHLLVTKIEHGFVYGDAHKVEQVLTNLVANAIKYIPKGRSIQIIWEPGEQGGALLKVIDNGQGIAKKHLTRLFERFYRVDEGRARDVGGTGLGLAIVKHIMISHGGWVRVQSEEGVGTEFTCYFPGGGGRGVTTTPAIGKSLNTR